MQRPDRSTRKSGELSPLKKNSLFFFDIFFLPLCEQCEKELSILVMTSDLCYGVVVLMPPKNVQCELAFCVVQVLYCTVLSLAALGSFNRH